MKESDSAPKDSMPKKTKIFELNTKNTDIEEYYKKIIEFYDSQQKRKMFKCPFDHCMRNFKEKGNLKTHIRVHTGERPFKCLIEGCRKSFITLGNLKSHILKHTGERPFECNFDGCNRKYSRLCRLKIHQRTHLGNKPFKCPFNDCGKEFNEKGNMKTHMRIHTGEKPYVCKFPGCNFSFKAHGHLKDHEKRHTNSKPFNCDVCGAKFARSSTLKIHKHTHTGEKPHICPVTGCCKKFSEKGNMRTHMKIHLLKRRRKLRRALPIKYIKDKVQPFIKESGNIVQESQGTSVSSIKKLNLEQNNILENVESPSTINSSCDMRAIINQNTACKLNITTEPSYSSILSSNNNLENMLNYIKSLNNDNLPHHLLNNQTFPNPLISNIPSFNSNNRMDINYSNLLPRNNLNICNMLPISCLNDYIMYKNEILRSINNNSYPNYTQENRNIILPSSYNNSNYYNNYINNTGNSNTNSNNCIYSDPYMSHNVLTNNSSFKCVNENVISQFNNLKQLLTVHKYDTNVPNNFINFNSYQVQ